MKRLFIILIVFYLVPFAQDPIKFSNNFPQSVTSDNSIKISFGVDQSIVKEYRYKLNVPFSWKGILGYAMNNYTEWKNIGYESITYKNFEVIGNYDFIVEYKTWSNQKKSVKRSFEVTKNNNSISGNINTGSITDYNITAKTNPEVLIVTVDGLNFKEILGDEYTLEDWDNYVGVAVDQMFIEDDRFEVHPFVWSRDPNYSSRAIKRLKEFLIDLWEKNRPKKLVIVSHSWGTVLAYAALNSIQRYDFDLDLLITLGSPLGSKYVSTVSNSTITTFIKDYVTSFFKHEDLCYKGCNPPVKIWINIWNYGDMLSGPVEAREPIVEDIQFDEDRLFFLNFQNNLTRNIYTTNNWHSYNSLRNDSQIENTNLRLEVKNYLQDILYSKDDKETDIDVDGGESHDKQQIESLLYKNLSAFNNEDLEMTLSHISSSANKYQQRKVTKKIFSMYDLISEIELLSI